MSGHPARFLIVLSFVLSLLVINTGSIAAQTGTVAVITPPDSSNFPHLTTYLDVHDAQGGFVHGLTAQSVTLQEDDKTIPASAVEELTPGVQFIIAISPGASFFIRDAMGVSRYEYLLQGLLGGSWTNQLPGVDDFSLLTLGGPQLIHLSDSAEVRSTLESYQPENSNTDPSLEILASALQVASDPTPRPGMERAILYITPPLETDLSLGLQSIIANANQQNIHINVWMLAPPEVFDSALINQLRDLATQTQGSFLGFSREEPIPDIESLLEPLRYVYQVGYDSQITTAGSHQVAAQVLIGSETITTSPQPFEVNLQPPALTLLNPPLQIARNFSTQPTPASTEISRELLPVEQSLKIKVDFPDGYVRPIVQTRLYVDGTIAAENINSPFDQFTWDLRPYTQNGEHSLAVEAVDSLGMIGKTGDISVEITVPSNTQGMFVALSRKSPFLVGAAVIVSGAILVLVLILGGRIRPKPHPGQARPMKRRTENGSPVAGNQLSIKPTKDNIRPANQTKLKAAWLAPLLSWWQAQIPWLKQTEEPMTAKAYLTPLIGFDEPTLKGPLQITTDDISLGSDPQRAGLLINDVSVEGEHAHLHYDGQAFVITDAGTVAGTWVNFKPVDGHGASLSHMDIIHLGRIGFRFQLSQPGPPRKLIVMPLEPRQ